MITLAVTITAYAAVLDDNGSGDHDSEHNGSEDVEFYIGFQSLELQVQQISE